MSVRLIRHFLAIAGGQILNTISTLLLLPLFLRHWSVLAAGEWVALSGLTNLLSTLDLGVNAAVNNRLLGAYTRKDTAEYLRCQHSAAAFYLSIAFGATLLLALALWLFPATSYAGVKRSAVPDAPWIVWFLALQVVWSLPVGLLGNFYQTIGDPAKTRWINNCKALGVLLITIGALLLSCTMRELALLQLIPLGLIAVGVLWDMSRHFPLYVPRLTQANAGVMRELLKPSLLFALIMVALSLTQQGSVLVVSTFFGGVAVITFYAARQLTNLAAQIVRMIATTACPDMTILYAQGDFARLRLLNRLVVTVSVTLCIAVVSALWFEGPSVVSVWSHHKIHVEPWFFRLLLLYLLLQAPWLANSNVTAAINRHQNQTWSYLASGILGLASMLLLAPHLGLRAVPIGLIIGEAAASYHFVIKDTCTVIGEPYAPYAARLWLGLVSVFSVALGAGWLAHQVLWGPPVLQWAEVGAATFFASCLAARFVWISLEERILLRQKFDVVRLRLKLPRVQTV